MTATAGAGADYAAPIVSVRWMGPADTLAIERHTTVVCVVYGGRASAGLAMVIAHTAAEVPLIVVSTAGRNIDLSGPRPELLAIDGAGGTLGGVVRQAAKASAEADLVLLATSCTVPPGWLPRLRAAALSDASVASATPLSSDGGTTGVSSLDGRDASKILEGQAADRVLAAVSRRTRPRLLVGGPHCLYLRRSALELIGGVPGDHETLTELTTDLCERFIAAGMLNVLADDVYVDAVAEPAALTGRALTNLDRSDGQSALQRAVQLSRSTLRGLSVTIDARSLGPTPGGTQRYTLELVLALARFTDATIRAVVAPDIGAEAEQMLRDAGRVEVISYEQAVAGVGLTDVVHRPQQVFSEGDLNLLRLLGRRLVVTHQDLIAYHNPTYHSTFAGFEQYRRITRLALAGADGVVFFSEHSRRDAEAEDLVDAGRASVVGVALDLRIATEPLPPPGAPVGEEFLLCLGPDYRHKNRCFAIELTGALRAEHGWDGKLVLAGAHAPNGSSRPDEEQLLARDPALALAVADLGSVDEAGRAWLFAHARAVLVPSVQEGFGLVPLEAAQARLPCLFAPVSSLVEVVDPTLATLVPWDPSRSAARAIRLLGETPERRRHIQRLVDSADRWTWQRLAGHLITCYEQALRRPYRAAAVRTWQELERERCLAESSREREELLRHLGNRIALASDEGCLTASQQQGLLRVGAHPALARYLLWPFALLGSIRAGALTGEPNEPPQLP